MRWAVVLVSATLVGACASIVGLDSPDGDPQADPTSSTSGDNGAPRASTSNGGPSATSSSSSSSSSGSSTSSGDAAPEGSAPPPPPKPVPATCASKSDCPSDNPEHDRCSVDGKCVAECIDSFDVPCEIRPEPCCIGFECKRLGSTPLSSQCVPKL